MKRHTNQNASQHLHIRIRPDDKAYIHKIVNQKGLDSITELILLSIKNVPIENKKYQREIIAAIKALTVELNHIGHNINQAVTAIHVMNLRHEFDPGHLQKFNELINTYLKKREQLKPLFKKILEQ